MADEEGDDQPSGATVVVPPDDSASPGPGQDPGRSGGRAEATSFVDGNSSFNHMVVERIPSAEEMAAMRAVDPSYPERLMRSWEEETEHRRARERANDERIFELQKRDQDFTFELQKKGQGVFTTTAIASMLVIGSVAAWMATFSPWAAAAVIAGGGALQVGSSLLKRKKALPPGDDS